MSVYLRKGLNFGPLRLNLSKGGVGLSGGVKGARVGLSPKGAYVHGGRHGLYYRKYASKGRKSTGGSRSRSDGEVRIFVDTGLTYRSKSGAGPSEMPKLPLPPRRPALVTVLFVAGALLALAGIGNNDWLLFIPALLLIFGGILLEKRHHKQASRARKTFRSIDRELDERGPVPDILGALHAAGVPDRWKTWLHYHVFARFLDAYFEDPDYIQPAEVEALEGELSLPWQHIIQMKAGAFSDFVEEVVEDHVVSPEEEQQLSRLREELRIPAEKVEWELNMVRQLCELRDAMEAPPEPVEADIPLKNNETCYFRTEGRLLKEKILQQYQRDRVRFKEVGYVVDMEGEIYLTDSRLLIVGQGSRSYPRNRILDTTLSLEDHTLQLTLDGRKSPLILSAPDLARLAGTIG
ncbi:MAG: DUF4236 domain-containing protein [Bacteroidales bacterium]